VGLTPFPNNLLTASGGFINLSFRKLIAPLMLGNFTLITLLSWLAQKGFGLI
jgi:membrane protein YqaA with SNARE-associated domain